MDVILLNVELFLVGDMLILEVPVVERNKISALNPELFVEGHLDAVLILSCMR